MPHRNRIIKKIAKSRVISSGLPRTQWAITRDVLSAVLCVDRWAIGRDKRSEIGDRFANARLGQVANISHAHPLAIHRKGGFVEFVDDSLKSSGLYCSYAPVFRSRRVYETMLFYEFGLHDIPASNVPPVHYSSWPLQPCTHVSCANFSFNPGTWGL